MTTLFVARIVGIPLLLILASTLDYRPEPA